MRIRCCLLEIKVHVYKVSPYFIKISSVIAQFRFLTRLYIQFMLNSFTSTCIMFNLINSKCKSIFI